MVLRLAETLQVPLRERNALLLAAGYAPLYRHTNLDTPEAEAARRAVELLMAQVEPYPVLVMDRYWNTLRMNTGAKRFFALFRGCDSVTPHNGVRLVFHPQGLRPFVENWESVAAFDRLVFRGHLRSIGHPRGMMTYLWFNQILLKDFGDHVAHVTERLKEASLAEAKAYERPVKYLNSGQADKETIAREILAQDGIRSGLVCVLSCLEPCWKFEIHRSQHTKKLELQLRSGKCLFLYHYQIHPVFGFLNARIQTWFPFSIQICINGREWLARQMEAAGLDYLQRDNCFPWIANWTKAQRLMDHQLKTKWPKLLDGIAFQLNPIHAQIFHKHPLSYYWSIYQHEWALDVVFHHATDLRRFYPGWVNHAMTTFSSPDILRFLGKRITLSGQLRQDFNREVISDFKRRAEGVRIKHSVNRNSVKLYDKAYTSKGSVLRAETTVPLLSG
jgi:MmyB-like transcription regulator ligand binding domain